MEPPEADQAAFRNRHGANSINVAAVSGPEHEIYAVCSSCPGFWHDSEVFLASDLFIKFDTENWPGPFPGSLLLGDSAYRGTFPFMATPYLDGVAEGDARKTAYNNAFRPTRNTVERTFGILKRRFSGLKTGIRMDDMANCARLIQVLIGIHNFILRNDFEDLHDYDDEEEALLPQHAPLPEAGDGTQTQTRDMILEQYF